MNESPLYNILIIRDRSEIEIKGILRESYSHAYRAGAGSTLAILARLDVEEIANKRLW